MEILGFLPPPCRGIDGMAEIILHRASVEIESTAKGATGEMVSFYEKTRENEFSYEPLGPCPQRDTRPLKLCLTTTRPTTRWFVRYSL